MPSLGETFTAMRPLRFGLSDWEYNLSDFQLWQCDRPMNTRAFTPSPRLWMLEIHIRHPSKSFGALYGDMLLDDHYFPDEARRMVEEDHEIDFRAPAGLF